MFDLLGELHRLPSAFDAAHWPLLDRLGLPSDLILFLPALGITPIETSGRFFEPSERGSSALILPAYHGFPPSFARPSEDEPEQPHDLIAFDPDRPGRWWLRVGCADMLGEHLAWSCSTWGQPLNLVATPLDYLRARCGAACLLDLGAVWKLRDIPTVVASDTALGRRIDRLLRKPPVGLPKILVRKEPPHLGLGDRP